MRSFLLGTGVPIFIFQVIFMNKKLLSMVRGAIIAALYIVLTNMQNILVPGSATWAIQLRVSEALCVLAFFSPAAIWGLGVGCLVFNLNYAGALPLDILVGTAATVQATWCMWRMRRLKVFGIPVPGLLMPALWNGLLVGWELSVYIGGAFWLNCLYVALGETIVLLTFGTALYLAMVRRKLDTRLFGA